MPCVSRRKNNTSNLTDCFVCLQMMMESTFLGSDEDTDDDDLRSSYRPPWTLLPINLVLSIFSYLSYKDIINAGATCRKWWPASRDELLWKQIFYQHWKIDTQCQLAPGFRSWRREFIRLHQWHANVPCVKAEEIKKHGDEALHVSFSHNGTMFATCSKDGSIMVWNSGHPVTLKHSADMKKYTWKYTQYSQFNKADTLLLVSGVHFGFQSTSGEIVVFNLDDFSLQVRVLNKPYDTFGTWLTNLYLLSGQQHNLGNLSTCSALWLNKADQEVESENELVVMLMYRFLNVMAASIRMLMIADCPLICLMDSQYTGKELDIDDIPESVQMGISPKSTGPWVYDDTSSAIDFSDSEQEASDVNQDSDTVDHSTVNGERLFGDEDLKLLSDERNSCLSVQNNDINEPTSTQEPTTYTSPSGASDDDTASSWTKLSSSSSQDFNNHPWLTREAIIQPSKTSSDDGASNGSLSLNIDGSEHGLTLHKDTESDLKRQTCSVDSMGEGSENSNHHSSTGHSADHSSTGHSADHSSTGHSADHSSTGHSADHSARKKRHCKNLCSDVKYLIYTTGLHTYTPHQIGIKRIHPDRTNTTAGSVPSLSTTHHKEYDNADYLIDLEGHINGMKLSPDNRYLFVNLRAWPRNSIITDPMQPPPISSEIEMRVIDLVTRKEVGKPYLGHKAYTACDSCFFIFPDVCRDYVASGAEDKHAYVWDRHYRTLITKLTHRDVVNAVAFNPADPEMMVTVSDDHVIRVWRSSRRLKELSAKKLPRKSNPSS